MSKNDDDSNVEQFTCDGCGGVSDGEGHEIGSASFVFLTGHVKDVIHRSNQWLMEKISKVAIKDVKISNEFNSFLNRKFVFKVQISKFNLQNINLTYIVHKMSGDEGVVGAVFKRSSAYEQDSIHSDGTPINKCLKDKSVSVDGDNIDVIDLDAVTLTTTSVKRPIEIFTTTESFEWSSSKDGVVAPILKISKMENLVGIVASKETCNICVQFSHSETTGSNDSRSDLEALLTQKNYLPSLLFLYYHHDLTVRQQRNWLPSHKLAAIAQLRRSSSSLPVRLSAKRLPSVPALTRNTSKQVRFSIWNMKGRWFGTKVRTKLFLMHVSMN
uniref:Uncharacterized protein n=1 Tax=Lactuca sativa TaxID=4236 RepID=A0A9R1WJU0_LACSA|nr:hypothetical protein LSAT_V11C200095440 [Lactuca sativa]